jgi:hypothetical protein
VELGMSGGEEKGRLPSEVEDKTGMYPDAQSWGPVIPAWGLWIRHAERVEMRQVRWSAARGDVRPAVLTGPNAAGVTIDGRAVLSVG